MRLVLLALAVVACARTATRGSRAQIVYMAPVKVAALGTAGYELMVMNVDGSNRRQLTDNAVQEFLPHFSPDATRLLYTKFTSGAYGQPDAQSAVAAYDFGTEREIVLTNTGTDAYPVWSPDGRRIAFLSRRDAPGENGPALWMMEADGSNPRRIAGPSGAAGDLFWGDIAWSNDDWILFVVAQNIGGCFKTRLDKIRPDGTGRTTVTDGGPNCTPPSMEQNGDADPGFSPDGSTIYSSRGFPHAPAGGPGTERRLYAFSSAPWFAAKPETDLSLPAQPSCIEGVPKVSPDGHRVLLFRACFDVAGAKAGVYLADAAGTWRTFVAEGFGPDWNPTVP
jgi:Tol biopolymer transport system component